MKGGYHKGRIARISGRIQLILGVAAFLGVLALTAVLTGMAIAQGCKGPTP